MRLVVLIVEVVLQVYGPDLVEMNSMIILIAASVVEVVVVLLQELQNNPSYNLSVNTRTHNHLKN